MLETALASGRALRTVFYLPVVTPWWFTHIVIRLIRVMARDHEVHVLVPPLWRNTGIGPEQIDLIAELPHVFWHVLDGPDHTNLRGDAAQPDDLFALIDHINPDVTLCRSADIVSPQRFPGTVRYIMEAAAPPFVTQSQCIWLAPTLFDYGMMPEFSPEQAAKLDTLAGPLWDQMHHALDLPPKEDFMSAHSLPDGRRIIGLPLEYEHEENFFDQHHRFAENAQMTTSIVATLDDDCVLAVTDHPLNALYGDTIALEAAITDTGGKAVLLDNDEEAGSVTLALAKHCDAMIVGNSKSWAACAAFGTPLLRLSNFATGGWVNAYHSLPEFLQDLANGNARSADPQLARRWFTFHLANCLIDPADPTLSADKIIARINTPSSLPAWTEAISRYRAQCDAQVA